MLVRHRDVSSHRIKIQKKNIFSRTKLNELSKFLRGRIESKFLFISLFIVSRFYKRLRNKNIFFILLQTGFESLTSKVRTAQCRGEAIHIASSIGTENTTESVFVGSHGLCIAAMRSRISQMRESACNPSRVSTNATWTTITIFVTISIAYLLAIVYKPEVSVTVHTSGIKCTGNFKTPVGSVQDEDNCGYSNNKLHILHFSVCNVDIVNEAH